MNGFVYLIQHRCTWENQISPNNPIPSWEEFNEGFEDFYYQEETREKVL